MFNEFASLPQFWIFEQDPIFKEKESGNYKNMCFPLKTMFFSTKNMFFFSILFFPPQKKYNILEKSTSGQPVLCFQNYDFLVGSADVRFKFFDKNTAIINYWYLS